jgi:hypothetical protein
MVTAGSWLRHPHRHQRALALSVAFLFVARASAQGAQSPSVDVPNKLVVTADSALSCYWNAQDTEIASPACDPTRAVHIRRNCMPEVTRSNLCTHSFDRYAGVVHGVTVNERTTATPESRFMADSLWYQKAYKPHVTTCICSTECDLFVTSPWPLAHVCVRCIDQLDRGNDS